jgi:hypothetical protein
MAEADMADNLREQMVMIQQRATETARITSAQVRELLDLAGPFSVVGTHDQIVITTDIGKWTSSSFPEVLQQAIDAYKRLEGITGSSPLLLTPRFTCPRCGRTSHNRNDVIESYCGSCHDWTSRS